jgi:hypothetical protein
MRKAFTLTVLCCYIYSFAQKTGKKVHCHLRHADHPIRHPSSLAKYQAYLSDEKIKTKKNRTMVVPSQSDDLKMIWPVTLLSYCHGKINITI